MQVAAAPSVVRAVPPFKPAYQPYTPAYTAPAAPSAYGQDTFVPTGYVPNDQNANVVYGEAKNMGLRFLGKTLNLKAPYIETALIDKTPNDPMDIENIDFNMKVKAAEVGVSDVDATLTIERMLAQKAATKGKAAPVSDLRVVFDPNNQIRVEGKVKAVGFNLPFQVKGTVNVDTAGQLRYDLGNAKVAGLPVSGLMKTFGLSVDKLLKLHNPNDGYYSEGNSIFVNVSQLISGIDGAPGLDARLRGVRTTAAGDLQLLVGDTAEDAQRALTRANEAGPAYVNGEGGHAYIDGFFLKNGKLSIYDRTPDSPLNLNATGGLERNIQLHSGQVGVTESRFGELIQEEIGDSDSLTGVHTELKGNYAQVSGKLWGAVPLSINMTFSATGDGRLMFTPSGSKAFGFIPLPGGLVSSKLQNLVKGGEPVGKGVALGKLDGIDLGFVSNVVHQDGYIVVETGKPAP